MYIRILTDLKLMRVTNANIYDAVGDSLYTLIAIKVTTIGWQRVTDVYNGPAKAAKALKNRTDGKNRLGLKKTTRTPVKYI